MSSRGLPAPRRQLQDKVILIHMAEYEDWRLRSPYGTSSRTSFENGSSASTVVPFDRTLGSSTGGQLRPSTHVPMAVAHLRSIGRPESATTTMTSVTRLAVETCPRAPECGNSSPTALLSAQSVSAPAHRLPTIGLGMVTTPRWTGDNRVAARHGGLGARSFAFPSHPNLGKESALRSAGKL